MDLHCVWIKALSFVFNQNLNSFIVNCHLDTCHLSAGMLDHIEEQFAYNLHEQHAPIFAMDLNVGFNEEVDA